MIKKQRGTEWKLHTHHIHAYNVSAYCYKWKLLETNVTVQCMYEDSVLH